MKKREIEERAKEKSTVFKLLSRNLSQCAIKFQCCVKFRTVMIGTRTHGFIMTPIKIQDNFYVICCSPL